MEKNLGSSGVCFCCTAVYFSLFAAVRTSPRSPLAQKKKHRNIEALTQFCQFARIFPSPFVSKVQNGESKKIFQKPLHYLEI